MDSQPTSGLSQGHADWAELLDPRRGGPGESPGRAAAVERAKRRSADRARARVKPPKNRK